MNKSNYKKEKETMTKFYTLAIIGGILSLAIVLLTVKSIQNHQKIELCKAFNSSEQSIIDCYFDN
jgi:hypothetical protein